jgi:hypothetical protein
MLKDITHCAIIEEFDTGWRGIYCHYDGYVYGHAVGTACGQNLIDFHNSATAARKLINLGYLISVSTDIKHCKKSQNRLKIGGNLEHLDGKIQMKPFYGDTIDTVADHIAHSGYVYIMSGGKWYVDIVNEGIYHRPLEELLTKDKPLLERLHDERLR